MKSKINKFFAWIIVFLLVIGLAGFGLQDVLSRWGTSRVASVGDITISTEDFRREFIQELNYLSKVLGKPITIEESKSMGLHLRTLERLLNKSVLDQILNDLHLSTGDTFLIKKLKRDQNFQNPSGNFSRQNYNLYLDRINLSENEFEAILRKDITRDFILRIVDGQFPVNTNIGTLIVDHAGEERLVSIYKANDEIVHVERNSNYKEQEEFFELNKEIYKSANIKKVSFLRLDPLNMAEQIEITDEELMKAFQLRKENYRKPVRKTLNRIVFSNKENAEFLFDQIVNGNQTFGGVANTRGLSPEEVTYGTFSKNQLTKTVSDLIFSNDFQIGDVVGPVLGELGYEIFEITDVLPAEELNFGKVKKFLQTELTQIKSREILSSALPEIEDMIAAGESLEAISKQFSIQVEFFDWETGIKPPEPFASEEFGRLANAATAETSDLMEMTSGILVTMRLDEEIAPKIPRLEDISNKVSNDFYKMKRIEALTEKVTHILTKNEPTAPLDGKYFDLLLEQKLNRQSNLEYIEPDTLQEIFQAKIGDLIVKPVSKGSIPYILIIKMEKIIPTSENATQYKKFKTAIQEQMTEEINNDLIFSMINSLRETYKPSVNVKMLNRIISNLQ
ncbi:MAG: SurA N-terminal domain-containing protein [Paracoccaceae bacterium]|nr:SurA N-terminal domain-containing protein [Paracoccaceae bacterium]